MNPGGGPAMQGAMTKHEHERSEHRVQPPPEVPTLRPPSRWRLLAAGLVTLAFLYFMYHSYDEEPEPPVPAKSSLVVGNG